MRPRQRGQALVEFALITSWLLLLLYGSMQFGSAFYTYDNLTKAVSDGARYASMRTYGGACQTTACSPVETSYATAIKNVVVYGTPSPAGGANPIVHSLSTTNVSVSVAAVNSVPSTVTVTISSYTLSVPLSPITLTNKPASTFPFVGRFAPPVS